MYLLSYRSASYFSFLVAVFISVKYEAFSLFETKQDLQYLNIRFTKLTKFTRSRSKIETTSVILILIQLQRLPLVVRRAIIKYKTLATWKVILFINHYLEAALKLQHIATCSDVTLSPLLTYQPSESLLPRVV